ncbi:MAG: AzlD domain-containing protein [Acidimicrobiia bacterium]|nr:AzlD domain-containing protein [Acidimicrobiia bacterium]
MNAWVAFAVAGVGTYVMRGLFVFVVGDRTLPPAAARALRNIGPAVLAALTASLLTSGGLAEFVTSVPEVSGIVAGVAVGMWRRSVGWTFAAAFATWALLTLTL